MKARHYLSAKALLASTALTLIGVAVLQGLAAATELIAAAIAGKKKKST